MKHRKVALISLSFCWIFSPDGLVLLGNLAGRGGYAFFFVLSAALVLYAFMAKIYRTEVLPLSSQRTTLGRTLPLTLSLACYFGLAVMLPTGALVTAGFTFNETFLYWFPNFGFSFLLLGIVLICHLVGQRVALALQVVSVGTALVCLAILAVVGFLQGLAQPSEEVDALMVAGGDWFFLLAASPLLFLGILDEKPALLSDSLNTSRRVYSVPLLVATTLLALWAAASLFHVPQGKLAGSTIPYIFSAREILGHPGRVLIGLTIISGALALLNGLLMLLQAELMAQSQRFALKRPSATNVQRLVSVLACVAIGGSMAGGLAGYDILEDLIKAVLVLWLFLTGLKALILSVSSGQTGLLVAPALLLLASLIYILALADILFTLKILLTLMTGSFAAATVWVRLSR